MIMRHSSKAFEASCAPRINGDNLEVQLHGFVAAARRSWEGGWKGGSERACNATLIATTNKLNRRLQKLLFVQKQIISLSSLQ
jgi:hypothetical protein